MNVHVSIFILSIIIFIFNNLINLSKYEILKISSALKRVYITRSVDFCIYISQNKYNTYLETYLCDNVRYIEHIIFLNILKILKFSKSLYSVKILYVYCVKIFYLILYYVKIFYLISYYVKIFYLLSIM